jgi:hypothetical protein
MPVPPTKELCDSNRHAPQYQPGMKLTREQAAALQERIGPMVNYIVRLRERATKVGSLPPTSSIRSC